jgi:hypothetical protein
MLINISDADKSGKRTLTVTDGDTKLYSGPVDNTAAGQKLANVGLKHGWDSDEFKAATKPSAKK